MAKIKTTRKRRRRTVSVKPTRRRRSTRKKGFLNDMVTPATAKGAIRAVANGMAGGAGAAVLKRLTDPLNLPTFWNIATPFIAGYAAAAFLKMPQVGAGFAAVAANRLMANIGLGDNNMYLQDHNYADQIKQLPPALDVNGQPMGDDEGNMYLQDNAGNMYLQDNQGNTYQVPYAPDFGSPTRPVTVDELV